MNDDQLMHIMKLVETTGIQVVQVTDGRIVIVRRDVIEAAYNQMATNPSAEAGVIFVKSGPLSADDILMADTVVSDPKVVKN